ncbi:MAG: hypothetical protein CSA79_01805 [Thiothrix nivea]|nr:MAG: hypothetical protein CSA79_01805 [Thiothrix nivea]
MYALDTNLLVYAHNIDSPLHASARQFLESEFNRRDEAGDFAVCIPSQALLEFLNTITWSRLETPLAMPDAVAVVQYYLDSGIPVIYPKSSQLHTVLTLLASVSSRKNIFDAGLAATLRDNGITGLYTLNVKDFKHFDFLDVVNPL